MSREGFAEAAGVSRETLERLDVYAGLLIKWQETINLVGPSTLPDLWRRHMLDSVQLQPLLPERLAALADLGSGAGFPGLVLAILGVPGIHLVESNVRKCTFLREVARATETRVTVHNRRIEEVAWTLAADVVTARACANLTYLLAWAYDILRPDGIAILHKGRYVDRELTESQKKWKMTFDKLPSVTDANGVLLRIGEIAPRHAD